MKTYIIAIICLFLGFFAGQIGKVAQIRATADNVAQDILAHCDVAIEKARAEATQETSDATLKACERKIDQITDDADDAISTCEILLNEANDEKKTAYDRGFNDCLAQF